MRELPVVRDRWRDVGGWELEDELEAIEIPDRGGRTLRIARVPNTERRFRSPMHPVAGMPPRLGHWRQELRSVLEGQPSTGRLREGTGARAEQDAMRRAIIGCLHRGLAAGLTVDSDGEVARRVVIPTGSPAPSTSPRSPTTIAPG